jgi:hypothetical protein
MDTKYQSRPLTTIFVTTVGDEENFSDCMAHLSLQTVSRPIEIIDHVAPLSAALQQMHERCRTPFYIQVDEDMMLFPEAVEKLEQRIERSAPEVALICAPLWDCDTSGPIQGLKIYRHSIVSRFRYEDCLSCETQQLSRIVAAGFVADLLPLKGRSGCFGEHGKHYTPEMIFKRWQRIFQKHMELGQRQWIEPWPRRLLDRYIENGKTLDLYALLGAIAGIVGAPAADREKDWREANLALERVQKYFPTVCTPFQGERANGKSPMAAAPARPGRAISGVSSFLPATTGSWWRRTQRRAIQLWRAARSSGTRSGAPT